jgi:hypothetical protein
MIAVQLEEGLHEDAESQIELLMVMNNAEDMSAEFIYLQAQVARLSGKRDLKKHLGCLEDCKDLFLKKASTSDPLTPFHDLVALSPDFLMVLAVEFLRQMEAPMPVSG